MSSPNDATDVSRQVSSQTCPSVVDHTFPKSSRLRTPADYQHVFAHATKFANRHWTLIVRPSDGQAPKLGLAIAKKQLPKAVSRNRVKRLARETFRQQKQALKGYDMVVLGRRGMTQADNATLIKSFKHLLNKIQKSGLTST